MLENGADLHVNERQKIKHYRARSTEERRRIRRRKEEEEEEEEKEEEEEERRRMPNSDFLLRVVST